MGKYDLSIKALFERDPEGMLRRFARDWKDGETGFAPVERELSMDIKRVDSSFRLWRDDQRWIEYFEAEISLTQEDLDAFLAKTVLQAIKHGVPVWPTIMLMSRHRRAEIPPRVAVVAGGCDYSMSPRYLRVWEIPSGVAEDDPVELLPIVGAMLATPGEMDLVIDRLSRIEDRQRRSDLSLELVTWCGLNYNKDEVREIRRRLGMATTRELFMASGIGEEILEYGKREGIEQGLAQGMERGLEQGREQGLEQGRESLRTVLVSLAEARFPGVLPPGFEQRLSSFGSLESLFRAMLAAEGADQVRETFARLADRQP